MSRDVASIKSTTRYKLLSPYQRVLFWIIYCQEVLGKSPVFLRDLIDLSMMSKPTVHKYVSELEDFEYIRNSIVRIPKEKNARGSKWVLKIELADEVSKNYAKRLYQMVTE